MAWAVALGKKKGRGRSDLTAGSVWVVFHPDPPRIRALAVNVHGSSFQTFAGRRYTEWTTIAGGSGPGIRRVSPARRMRRRGPHPFFITNINCFSRVLNPEGISPVGRA